MDNSRDRDLYLLHERFHDMNLSAGKRRAAWRKFASIQAQVRDRKLTNLRHRLVRAVQADDHDWISKLSDQIKEHSYRMGYEKAVAYENTSD